MQQAARLQEKVAHHLGLSPQSLTLINEQKVIEAFAQRHGIPARDLARSLEKDPQLLVELAGNFTVGESHFFRHPSHYDFLEDFLAQRFLERGRSQPVQICSAGCSSGEEPYSLAMLLHELGYPAQSGLWDIQACDASNEQITKARSGVYTSWSFRGAPPWILGEYFTLHEKNRCQLRSDILASVALSCAEIGAHLAQVASGSLDVILFRNVAIYLTPRKLEEVYDAFHRVLRDDGILIVAPADPRPSGDFIALPHKSTSVYRKAVTGTPTAVGERRTKLAGKAHSFVAPPVAPERPKARQRRRVSRALERPSYQANGNSPTLYAHQGSHYEDAIAIATCVIEQDKTVGCGYLLRGQLHFSEQKLDDAIADFRRALFVDATDCIARYWYASALQAAGQVDMAMRELMFLAERLQACPPDDLQSDGETTARELVAAVEFLQESMV